MFCFRERFLRPARDRVADGFVKRIGKKWFRHLCLFAELFHLFEQVAERSFLPAHFLREVTALLLGVVGAGVGVRFFSELIEFFSDALLLGVEFASCVSDRFHLFRKTTGSSFTEFLLHFLKLILGTGGSVGGIGQIAFFEFLGCFLNIFPGFFEFFFFFRHVGTVLFRVHSLAEVIEFPKEFLLLFLKAFELTFDFRFFFFVRVL